MRTANEIELFPMAQDLVDIVSLSKIFAAHDGVTLEEACELVTSAIVHGDEIIEVYRTDKPGIPKCIGEVNDKDNDSYVLGALWMPFRSQWWKNPASLTVIQAGWDGTPDSVAIRKTDAARLINPTLFDHVVHEFPDDVCRELDPQDRPEELDSANMAFQAVTNGFGDPSETFRIRLVDYLKKTFPKFTNDAVQRIATVANPSKSPGRKKNNKQ
jgi:hypothetical protein